MPKTKIIYKQFCKLIAFRNQLQKDQERLLNIDYFNSQLEEYLQVSTPLRINLGERNSTKVEILYQMTASELTAIRKTLSAALCQLLTVGNPTAAVKYIKSLEKKAIQDAAAKKKTEKAPSEA